MFNYDPNELVRWSWEFHQKYKNNEEEGMELYHRIMKNDTGTALFWPRYEDIAFYFICMN